MQELSDPADRNETITFKPQKGSKVIIKIVHVTSVVQLYYYEAMTILSVCKENNNNDLIQQFLLFRVSLWRASMLVLLWELSL